MKRIALAVLVAIMASSCGLGMDASSASQAVGAKNPAADQEARADLQTAVTAAQEVSMGGGGYGAANPAALQQAEPSLSYVTGASTGPQTVSVAAQGGTWIGAVRSTSGACFYTVLATGAAPRSSSTHGVCSAAVVAQAGDS